MQSRLAVASISFVVVTTMILSASGIINAVSAVDIMDHILPDEDMDACYVASDDVTVSGVKVDVSSVVGVWNCHWDDNRNKWQYDYKVGGMGVSTGGKLIRGTMIQVESQKDDNDIDIEVMLNDKYTWSSPSSSPNGANAALSVSNLLMSVLISAIGTPAAGVAWSVASAVISSMGPGVDDFSYHNNYRNLGWSWSSDINKTAQQAIFQAYLIPGVTKSLTAEYVVFGPGYEVLTPGVFKMTMTSPNVRGDSPTEMTIPERESQGIITVQRENLTSGALELSLSSEVIDNMLSSEEDEFYFASAPVRCEFIKNSSVDVAQKSIDGLNPRSGNDCYAVVSSERIINDLRGPRYWTVAMMNDSFTLNKLDQNCLSKSGQDRLDDGTSKLIDGSRGLDAS